MDVDKRSSSSGRQDASMASAKTQIQRQSRQEVMSGKLAQTDLFLIRPERALRAVVSLKG